MTLPPPTLSKAAGGYRGQMSAGDTGPGTSHPHATGVRLESLVRLTFPIKIVVRDANVNEALEDLQGEQRRAAGGGHWHPPDMPCAAWPRASSFLSTSVWHKRA